MELFFIFLYAKPTSADYELLSLVFELNVLECLNKMTVFVRG
jgi:hypothetical protein